MNDLEQVYLDVSTCTLCGLHTTRNATVPGTGSHVARLMFVGEAFL